MKIYELTNNGCEAVTCLPEIDFQEDKVFRSKINDNELKLVARALLPDGIAEGTRLKYEMLQYEIEG